MELGGFGFPQGAYFRLKGALLRLWTVLLLLIFVPMANASEAAERPSYRVLTFQGENAYEASQTVYQPTSDGFYHTEVLESFTHVTNKECDDIISNHQKRALETMLENRYITSAVFKELTDPERRAHKLSQYILATSFIELTPHEVEARGVAKERILDRNLENGKVRVHLGSLFFVRGYELHRNAQNTGGKVLPLSLPLQIGTVPASLAKPLDRTHLTAAVEIGRAFLEDGAPKDEFSRLMQILGAALAGDAQVLNLDPSEFALFGHSYDSQHIRLFSMLFPARPLTPEMQARLEANPREFFAHYLEAPSPSKEEWKKFDDAVSIGSLQALLDKFPAAKYSEFANKTSSSLPTFLSPAKRLRLMRETMASHRHDYDFKWPDEHRPGQRKPIQMRDYGTPLWLLDIGDSIERAGMVNSEANLNLMLETVIQNHLKLEPDLGSADWFERSVYVPITKAKTIGGEGLGAIVISNLDPAVPSKEMAGYLGEVLLAVTAKIELRLMNLTSPQRAFVLKEMNQVRSSKGLAPTSEVSLQSYLQTYDLVFASEDPAIRRELPILGGSPQTVLKIHRNAKGGKVKVDLDISKLGLDFAALMRDPSQLMEAGMRVFKEQLQGAISTITGYRFDMNEVLEQREEHPRTAQMGAHHLLQESYHPQRIQRLYITYQ